MVRCTGSVILSSRERPDLPFSAYTVIIHMYSVLLPQFYSTGIIMMVFSSLCPGHYGIFAIEQSVRHGCNPYSRLAAQHDVYAESKRTRQDGLTHAN